MTKWHQNTNSFYQDYVLSYQSRISAIRRSHAKIINTHTANFLCDRI